MEHKIWLVEGFCPVDGYHCLMPVEYEPLQQEGVAQEYYKSRMGCRHALQGMCQQEEECHFFRAAPPVLDKNAPWHE